MKKLKLVLAVIMGMMLSSCEIVGAIFKAGMYWGVFLVIAFIGLIVYLITKGRRK